jgi:hypothetical protein
MGHTPTACKGTIRPRAEGMEHQTREDRREEKETSETREAC